LGILAALDRNRRWVYTHRRFFVFRSKEILVNDAISKNRKDRELAVPILVRMKPSLIEELDKVANSEGIYGRSAIVRRACLEFLKRREQTAGEANV
jgi:hypothetical protein